MFIKDSEGKERKQVPVITTMRPGSRLMVAEKEEENEEEERWS